MKEGGYNREVERLLGLLLRGDDRDIQFYTLEGKNKYDS